MYYTSNAPGLQVSLALPRFVCPHTPPVGFPVFARFLCLSGFGYAPLFARFSHRECVRSLCALPQALHTSPINPLPALFSFSRARLFIIPPFRTMPQHKTSFIPIVKNLFCNSSDLIVLCPLRLPCRHTFSLSYSLYNKSLWQSHGKRLPFRPTLISIFCSFCALIQSVSSPVFFPLLFAASAPPATAHYTHLFRPPCIFFAGRLSSQTFLPLHPRPQRQAALPLPYYFFLPLPIALIFSLYCSGLSLFSLCP